MQTGTVAAKVVCFFDLQTILEYFGFGGFGCGGLWKGIAICGVANWVIMERLVNGDYKSPPIGYRIANPEERGNLPDPDVLAEEIVENLEAALGSFREIIASLGKKN